MKFSTRQDIEAPIEFVFSQITDFDRFERQGLRRGVEVSREDPSGAPGLGSTWKIRATFRGKPRNIVSELTAYEAPSSLTLLSETNGLTIESEVGLLALSPRRTRMTIGIELKPVSLTGRLLIQSLKFAKSTLNARFTKRAGEFATTVEDRYRTTMV
jgi:hypothetical protein